MIKKFILTFFAMMVIIFLSQLVMNRETVQFTWHFLMALSLGAAAGSVVALTITFFIERRKKQ